MLKDKVAIITGASSGIGRATALLFAREGAALVVNARGQTRLDRLVADVEGAGGRIASVCGDVAEERVHQEMVDTALARFGRLDIAFNNAGSVGPIKPLAEASLVEWRQTVDINLTSAFLGAKLQIPAMLAGEGGSIIFTSSFVGSSVGLPGMTVYAASKAALTGLVKGITADYAARGIRCNALLPGGTDTPMGGDEAQKEWAAGLHALKRIARPEEIAAAALFLAGPMGSFVAGTALYVDGGNSATK